MNKTGILPASQEASRIERDVDIDQIIMQMINLNCDQYTKE